MPPKRKRANADIEGDVPTKSTRSSARLGKKKGEEAPVSKPAASAPKTLKQSAKDIAAANVDDDVQDAPAAKKTKTAAKSKTTKATSARSTAAKAKTGTAAAKSDGAADVTDAPAKSMVPKSADVKKAVHSTPAKPEPYNRTRAASLFATYADTDDTSIIGPEGFERLCTDAGVSLDGVMPLLLAWEVDGKEMAKLTQDEWVKGMDKLQISSLHVLSTALHELNDLVILGKPPRARTESTQKKPTGGGIPTYNRAHYYQCAQDSKRALSSFYTFCFQLVKPESSRNIEIDTASAIWSVVLLPRYPIVAEILEFITESGSYKAANKDLWNMIFEFCDMVHPDLSNYEADGAWPTMIDDFVAWKKAKDCSGGKQAVEAEPSHIY